MGTLRLPAGVNLLGLVAGAGGSMKPVLAALLHNTSSIVVVGNSARLVNHTPHLPRVGEDVLRRAPLEEGRVAHRDPAGRADDEPEP